MEVSDILRDRMHEPAGLQQMAVASVLLHGALAAFLVLAPGRWLAQRVETPREVMTISLAAGTPGPTSGGMTAIGGRASHPMATIAYGTQGPRRFGSWSFMDATIPWIYFALSAARCSAVSDSSCSRLSKGTYAARMTKP